MGARGFNGAEERPKSPGEKFHLLLQRFRRSDGRVYGGRQIEQASGNRVSASYISLLKKDGVQRPGAEALAIIAEVVGFPATLWELEPSEWDAELRRVRDEVAERRRRASVSPRSEEVDGYGRLPQADTLTGSDLARHVNFLFENAFDYRTGRPFSEWQIARRSGYLVTEEEVRSIRQGESGPIGEAKLRALSEAFGISDAFWEATSAEEQRDAEVASAVEDFLAREYQLGGLGRSLPGSGSGPGRLTDADRLRIRELIREVGRRLDRPSD